MPNDGKRRKKLPSGGSRTQLVDDPVVFMKYAGLRLFVNRICCRFRLKKYCGDYDRRPQD